MRTEEGRGLSRLVLSDAGRLGKECNAEQHLPVMGLHCMGFTAHFMLAGASQRSQGRPQNFNIPMANLHARGYGGRKFSHAFRTGQGFLFIFGIILAPSDRDKSG